MQEEEGEGEGCLRSTPVLLFFEAARNASKLIPPRRGLLDFDIPPRLPLSTPTHLEKAGRTTKFESLPLFLTIMSTPDLATILSIFDPATLLQRGHVAVALSPSRAPKPHKIYYELHGPPNPSAPRVVLIMGLNNSCFAWTNQVNWLVGRGFQVLVFDNRGVGHSDTPEGKLWKTSEMALDALELLDYLGWKEEVGLMGVSMGGMIALELAQLAPPGRFSSLGLISTRAGNRNDLPSYKATYMFLRLLTGTVWSAQQAIALIVDTLFPASYLDVKDLTTDPIVSKRKSVEAVSPPPYALAY